MVKKIQGASAGAHPGKTRVSVLVVEADGNSVRVDSSQASRASAIITALDRTFAAYSDDIEAETANWIGLTSGLFDAFRAVFKLPSAKAMLTRHHRDQALDKRAADLDQRERDLADRDHNVSIRESIATENRTRFDQITNDLDARATALDKREDAERPIYPGANITGESVTITADGALVRVVVNGVLREYTETIVIWPESARDPVLDLARLLNLYGFDAATNLADHVLAQKLMEHIERLREMDTEIKAAGNSVTVDPDADPDAEPIVGTAPVILESQAARGDRGRGRLDMPKPLD